MVIKVNKIEKVSKIEDTSRFNILKEQAGVKENSDMVFSYWKELEGHRLSPKSLDTLMILLVQDCFRALDSNFDETNSLKIKNILIKHFGVNIKRYIE